MRGPVISLAGEWVASPVPNLPGWWAYRQLEDGTKLEVSLTRQEWQHLQQQLKGDEYAGIIELNGHPLNQAALRRLHQQGLAAPERRMYLLSLANGRCEDKELLHWGTSEGLQARALEALEANIDASFVEKASLPELQDRVLETLRALPWPYD